MARINKKTVTPIVETHGGGVASRINNNLELLRRSVMSCLLWEDEFYEDGKNISNRIIELANTVNPDEVAKLAIEARDKMKLRHVPLLLCRILAKRGYKVADTLAHVIQRPDELTEFLAIYWKDGKQPISAQVKKGLAKAFTKFDEYQLAKYNRDNDIKLKDVLFLSHAKPDNDIQAMLWKKLINDELNVPDTWEVALSAGKDKKETFERLINERKLGGMALLRNLRNMVDSNVDKDIVEKALQNMNVDRVLPFRFISAAKNAPRFEQSIEQAMFKCLNNKEKLPGKTLLIVDISGSMGGSLSRKSDMNRLDAANALAILVRELCEKPIIYATAGDDCKRTHATDIVPPRRGFALPEAIKSLNHKLGGGGIFLKQVMDYVYSKEGNVDRVIVITDEQDCDSGGVNSPENAKVIGKTNYIVNIASYDKGIAYKKWTHINGWSEAVIDYILEYEKQSW